MASSDEAALRHRKYLIDSAELISALIALNEPLRGLDGVRPVGSNAGMSAIMQQNYVSARMVALDAIARVSLNRIGGGS